MLSILNSVNTLLCLSRQQPSNADTRIVTSQNEEGGRSSTQFEGGQVELRIMQNSLGRSFQICCNTEESCTY